MAKLSRDDYDIQRCQLFLDFKPKHSTGARQIEAFRVFDHQTFVQAPSSLLKRLLDFDRRMSRDYARNLKLRRQSHTTKMASPLAQRSCKERLPVQPKKIKHDKCYRHVCRCSRKQIFTVVLAAEPPLQIEEGEPPTFLEGDYFTVDNQVFLKVPGLIGQFRKLPGDAAQIAGENFNPLCTAMELRADSIEFVFQINRG